MGAGITPYDFVQQVYYAQEKVLLDFWPTDDKYREVLVEANLVLQELEAQEDWTWLRQRLILGPVDAPKGVIPEFQLPEGARLSALYKDTLKLCPIDRRTGMPGNIGCIEVPLLSPGYNGARQMRQYGTVGMPGYGGQPLGAVCIGDTVTFNRPLHRSESKGRLLVADVQMPIEKFHVCNDACTLDADHKCAKASERYLTEVPMPNYVVIQTAARHAEGSPPAQARIQGLTDQAQRLLSTMRSNDANATESDYADWDDLSYVSVV